MLNEPLNSRGIRQYLGAWVKYKLSQSTSTGQETQDYYELSRELWRGLALEQQAFINDQLDTFTQDEQGPIAIDLLAQLPEPEPAAEVEQPAQDVPAEYARLYGRHPHLCYAHGFQHLSTFSTEQMTKLSLMNRVFAS